MSRQRQGQQGFAYIAAIVLLVVMAALALAMIRLTTTQQTTADQDVQGVRANQVARAGVEWGLYRIRSGNCAASTTLSDFASDTGFRVTVNCSANPYPEGERPANTSWIKTIYQITATACNGSGDCPDNAIAARVDYVERKRVATACIAAGNIDCYSPD